MTGVGSWSLRMFVKAGTFAEEFESFVVGVHEYVSVFDDRRDNKEPL